VKNLKMPEQLADDVFSEKEKEVIRESLSQKEIVSWSAIRDNDKEMQGERL
jgi:hypothetical protein